MKRNGMIVSVIALVLIVMTFAGCGGGKNDKTNNAPATNNPSGSGVTAPATTGSGVGGQTTTGAITGGAVQKPEMPADLKAFVDAQVAATAEQAKKLCGEWADWHVEMVESGIGRSLPGVGAHIQTLKDYQVKSGAYYVYTMWTYDPKSETYMIGLDSSEKPEGFGMDYGFEIQFQEAWEGKPSAARSAWDNNVEITDLCWSTFAPIRDSTGKVVAILGVDMPAPLAKKYPEWNRDNEKWNGVRE